MKILPKKSEVAVVVELLESGEYETPEALGHAIVKSVYLALAERESYAVAVDAKPFEFFWPFFYEADAKRFSAQLGGPNDERRFLLKMRSPLMDEATQQKYDAEAKERSKHINWPAEGQTLSIPGGKRT